MQQHVTFGKKLEIGQTCHNMPPVRTAKRHSTAPLNSRSNAPAAQISTIPTTVDLHKSVHFRGDKEWEARASRLSSRTRKISFGSEFVLTIKHIEDLLAMGPSICEKLWEFEFIYDDVTYGAHNSATDLTNAAIKLIAQSCPSLRRVKLPGTCDLTHEALVVLFENCPSLSEVEITGASRSGRNNTGAIFALLLERQDLAPKLHKLRLDPMSNDEMKAMRAVTKQRKKLLVQVVSVHEEKKWGDWELVVHADNYRKGRIRTGATYGSLYGGK
ncbi:hypothetical protein F5883DRAFT_583281 [Diaporthe sp. PMI_573]|nr:hypothetical protein F5883DRAFT_583281 [Diaporthaceae sp. PMI_573]